MWPIVASIDWLAVPKRVVSAIVARAMDGTVEPLGPVESLGAALLVPVLLGVAWVVNDWA